MKKVLACLSGVVVTLAAASGAQAQESSGAVGLELEEVVVTATKRETDLQKTSVSIQTYSGAELRQQGKKRIDEIMNGVVGVNSQDSQVGNSFYIRGVESGGGGAPGGTPSQTSVAIIIDGVYQNRSETVRGGTLDVAQVEVARGAQSTNLGASAIAGAISIVSNQPVFEYQASGSIEVGNYHLQNLEGVLNVPLSDSQAFRFAYSTNKRDGYISAGAGDSDLTNARLKYRWKASDDLDMVFTANHQNIGGNGVQAGVLLATGHWVPYNPTALVSNAAGTAQIPMSQVFQTTAATTGGVTFPSVFNGCSTVNGTTSAPAFTAVNTASGITTSSSTGTIGAVSQFMGCPTLFVAVNDGKYWFDRENPWDDGYPAGVWPNNPFRNTNIDSFSADINWNLGVGKLTVTPSYQLSTFKSQEVARMTSWMAEDREQETRQIEARLTSQGDSRLQWMGGLYYYWTNNTGTFENILMPNGVINATTAATAITGTCPYYLNGGNGPVASRVLNSSYCYTWSNTKESRQETISAYTQETFSMTDSLRLLGGLRYSQDYKNVISSPDGALNSTIGAVQGTAGTAGANTAVSATTIFYPTGSMAPPESVYNYSQVGSGKWHALTYRAGFEYDVREQSMLYATLSNAYQPGAYDAMTNRVSKKFMLDQLTLGLKNRFFDNRLQVNIEAFATAYKDRPLTGNSALGQVNAFITGGSTNCNNGNTNTNTGPTTTDIYGAVVATDGSYACVRYRGDTPTIPKQSQRGADFELTWATTSDRVDFSVEYLRAVFDSDPQLYADLPTASVILTEAGITAPTVAQTAIAQAAADAYAQYVSGYSGLTLQNSPKYSGNLAYQHQFQMPGGSRLTPRVNMQYKSEYWTSPGTGTGITQVAAAKRNGTFAPFIQGAYSLFDVYLNWQSSDGKFNVGTYVKNIENEPVLQNGGVDYVSLNAPRTWGMTMSASF